MSNECEEIQRHNLTSCSIIDEIEFPVESIIEDLLISSETNMPLLNVSMTESVVITLSAEINGTVLNNNHCIAETVDSQVVDHVTVELEIPCERCSGLDESRRANTSLPLTFIEESVIISF